ncbi:DUF748 domain-containing protein [Flammeovirgaceae bacterium SG7u.111]|nr:DUF748 domain-containing protein [Flammeovirgaceae bacterium SG7u.132]WPO34749.1 DUF748 domain-containing protein [Flammeovirgaceae bacterium SG7u.111]
MKKRYYIFIAIALLLIVGRLVLPHYVAKYVNKTLDNIEGYHGQIEDVDLHLYRGAYVIKQLKIVKTDGDAPVPFVDIPTTDLSVEWKSLFKGSLVGEISFTNPELNFIASVESESTEKAKTTKQTGEEVDWTEPLKELLPIKINHLKIVDGKITFQDLMAKPQVELFIDSLYMDVSNLSNVVRNDKKLPSVVALTGRSIGEGSLDISGKANFVKQIPDLDLKVKFTEVELVALNKFFNAYGNFDAERGEFNLFSELTIDNNNIDGYLKPFMSNVKIFNLQKDVEEKNFFQAMWEGITGVVSEVVENPKEDNIATEIPLQGEISEPETNVAKAAINVLKHAFIKAYDESFNDKGKPE